MKEKQIYFSETELKYLIWALSREQQKYEKVLANLNELEAKRKRLSRHIVTVEVIPANVHELESLDEQLKITKAEFERLGDFKPILTNSMIAYRLVRILRGGRLRRDKDYNDALESMLIP